LIGTLVEQLEPSGPLGLHDRQLLSRQGTRTYETTFTCAEGTTHTMVVHKASFTASGDTGGGVIGVLLDITDRKRLETKLQRLATTDELTGIANRRRFFELARAELGDARRRSRPLALLLLDIDHFKVINDTYGHAAGDETLKMTASICERDLRERDVLARIGGEELAIILPETDLEVATDVAERLRLRIADARVSFSDREIRFTVSIGVTERNDLDRSVHSILLRADKALYKAKRDGRNRVASTG
jgi:diguanylate cyclase (GGDEF)-like protein